MPNDAFARVKFTKNTFMPMKYCPTCQTRYDEEIIRFCTKDGTPLVSEEEPNFIEMPSESLAEQRVEEEDDPSEVTIVRNNVSAPPPVPDDDMNFDAEPAQRIVVPTEPAPTGYGAMPPPGQRAYQPPPRSNTFKVVVLTFLGTVIILGAAGLVFWALVHERGNGANTNANSNLSNQNTNVNTMIDSNFNFDVGNIENANSNANANANLKTPTPTPKLSPSPTVSPTETPSNANSANTNAAPPFSPRPTPVISPTPPGTPSNRGPVNAGALNGRAISLATPTYPPAARAMRASGPVTVQIMIDEGGNVISAHAVSGNPLLRDSAEAAARRSRFSPVRLSGQPVKATGFVSYNFVSN
jgi:TonB family protein